MHAASFIAPGLLIRAVGIHIDAVHANCRARLHWYQAGMGGWPFGRWPSCGLRHERTYRMTTVGRCAARNWTFALICAAFFGAAASSTVQTAQRTDTTPDAADAAPWTSSRTPDGQPDLQSVWVNATVTPLERPTELAGKEFFTDVAEARAWEAGALDRLIQGDEAWVNTGTVLPTLRTSLIVDPPDGRIPYTREGRDRWEQTPTALRDNPNSGPESRALSERCIVWGEGPPLLPRRNNPYIQIVQTAEHAVIVTELIHHARIVPLDGRPHLAEQLRQWVGDSRGWWDGETLVVDTRNFNSQVSFRGSTDALRVTERFTRVSRDLLRYRFTVEDRRAYTRPWSGEIFFERTDDPIFEFACHEGNRSMRSMLSMPDNAEGTLPRVTRRIRAVVEASPGRWSGVAALLFTAGATIGYAFWRAQRSSEARFRPR